MSGQDPQGRKRPAPARAGGSNPPASSGEGALSALAAMLKDRLTRASPDEPDTPRKPPATGRIAADTIAHDDQRRPPDVPPDGGRS